jgi:hypothetical protein
MNEFTALQGILAPGTAVYGYQRGHEVPAAVVEAWGLTVGDQVCEGDLDADAPAPVAVPRPGPESNRAAWESWAIANGWKAEDAAEASIEDLEAVAPAPALRRSAKRKPAGDPVAVAASDALNG